jgi:uncharacterized protein (DUF1015 family)
MVELTPVRAWHPNSPAWDAASLVCPVYDTLTDAELQEFSSHPHNPARFVPRPVSVTREQFLERSRAGLRAALDAGAFVRDERPGFYLYGIRYMPPPDILEALVPAQRRPEYLLLGLVGALDVSRIGHGQVALHERTFPDRVADRVALTDATDVTFAPIVLGYHASDHRVNDRLERLLGIRRSELSFESSVPPVAEASLLGTTHRLWRLDTPAEVEGIRHELESLRLLVLDGHHRFTAAARRFYEGRPSAPLVMLVDGEDRALQLLPWHRVLPAAVETFDRLLEEARNQFPEVLEVATPLSPEVVVARLHAMRLTGVRGFLMASADRFFEVRGPPSDDVGADFDLLHGFLDDTLEIDPEALEFHRSPRRALERVRAAGAGTALLLPGLTTRGIEDRAFGRGEVMAQKSTMFLPKVAEGMLFAPAGGDSLLRNESSAATSESGRA